MTPGAGESGPEPPDIVFSMTRLMKRVLSQTPTGVDRVVLAYARALAADPAVRFSGVNPLFKRYGRLSRKWVLRYIDVLERRWTLGDGRHRAIRRVIAFWRMVGLFPLPVPRQRGVRILLDASHSHLDHPALLEAVLRRERALFVPLVHDLIPIDFPEYARHDGAALHRRRLATARRHAAVVLANSQATADATVRLLAADAGAGADPPRVVAAPLGTDAVVGVEPDPSFAVPLQPYFLCLGTIEPRKNHLLLLHLWRRLAAERLAATIPQLVIVGRRGWENENIVDMLERSPGIRAHVTEHGRLSDGAVARLLQGACALLLPSFAEGFGLPVVEALARWVPVICSDLAVLREIGGDVPDFLDPLDGPAWLTAIADYAAPGSPRRAAQCARMAGWRPTTWASHMDIVRSVVYDLAQHPPEQRAAFPRASA